MTGFEQVLPNVFRVPVPLPNSPLRELNSYIIRSTERSLIIDTGFPRQVCRDAFDAAFEKLELDRSSIDVLLTHMHSDHSGLAPELVSRDGVVYIGEADLPRMDSLVQLALFGSATERFFAEGVPTFETGKMSIGNPAISSRPIDGICEYSALADGQFLDYGGYSLKVISVPGHTPGNICLWEAQTKTMFTGDHVLFDITPNITAWPELEDSLGKYIRSLMRVSAYDVELALPGHRRRGDFAERVGQLLTHHEQRLDECFSIILANPGLCLWEIAPRMSWNIKASSWESFPPVQKWFALGECLSHLDRLEATGRIERRKESGVMRNYPAYEGE